MIRNEAGFELRYKKDCWVTGEHLCSIGWNGVEVKTASNDVKVMVMRQDEASNILELSDFADRTLILAVLMNHNLMSRLRSSSILNLVKAFKIFHQRAGISYVTEGSLTQKFVVTLNAEMYCRDPKSLSRLSPAYQGPAILFPEAISDRGIPDFVEPQTTLQVRKAGHVASIPLTSIRSLLQPDLQELREEDTESHSISLQTYTVADLKTLSQIQLDQFGLLQIALFVPNTQQTKTPAEIQTENQTKESQPAHYYLVKKLLADRVKESGFHDQLIVGICNNLRTKSTSGENSPKPGEAHLCLVLCSSSSCREDFCT